MDGYGLLQIGVFSRLSRTSVRMLRHYAEHGLLTPALVDPISGYRYYDRSQLAQAQRICSLRDAGFTVAQMASTLASFDDPKTLASVLSAQRRQLNLEQFRAEQRLVALDRLIYSLEEPRMAIDIHTTTMPAMTIAGLREVISSYDVEQELWDRLMPQLRPDVYLPDALCGATYFDEDYRESDVDVEVWVQVNREAAAGAARLSEIPAQQILSTTLRGSYDQLNAVCQELGSYVAYHGLATGPMFNIYRVSPAQDPNPDNWVTDVCLPIIATAS